MKADKILITDDEPHIRRFLSYNVNQLGYQTTLASNGAECLEKLRHDSFAALLLDIRMPEADGLQVLAKVQHECPQMPVIMITADHSIDTAVIAIKKGAFDYLTKPVDFDRLQIVLRNALKQNELNMQVGQLSGQLQRNKLFANIIGQSEALQTVFGQVEKILNTDLNVLVTGESGTGKELLAQAIHNGSSRKKGAFVAVNCAAITHELAESLLFGHKKGAFTGATEDRPGYFEQANNGTIFLDEIGDMTPEVQAKVLRVLEEKQVQRVGCQQVLKLDFRVVSATNRDLLQAVNERTFRKDLYFRLEEYPVHLPPLRERTGDVAILAQNFLDQFNRAQDMPAQKFAPSALLRMEAYPWSGNIRELKNYVRRAALQSDLPVIEKVYLDDEPVAVPKIPELRKTDKIHSLNEMELDSIRNAYQQAEGNAAAAAKLLGISRATMYRKLKSLGIVKRSFK